MVSLQVSNQAVLEVLLLCLQKLSPECMNFAVELPMLL